MAAEILRLSVPKTTPDSGNRLPFRTVAAPASDATWGMPGLRFRIGDYRGARARRRSRVAASRRLSEMPDLDN